MELKDCHFRECRAPVSCSNGTGAHGRKGPDRTMKEAVLWQGTRAPSLPYEQEDNKGKNSSKPQRCSFWIKKNNELSGIHGRRLCA